ncbi:MAG: hypothetical protein ACRDL5_17280 [Solirubrobacteraceae bacterium]
MGALKIKSASGVWEYRGEVVGEQWVGDRPFAAGGAAVDDPGCGERVERAPGGLCLDLAVCGRPVREVREHAERSRREAAGIEQRIGVPFSLRGHCTLVAALCGREIQSPRVLLDDRDVRLLGDQHRAARMGAPGGHDPLQRARVDFDLVLGEPG